MEPSRPTTGKQPKALASRTDQKSRPQTRPPIRGRWMLIVIRILCVVAIGVSIYLTLASFQVSSLSGCGGTWVTDCGDVLKSRWARWFGLN